MDVLRYIQKNDMVKILLILLGVYLFMKYYHKENLDNTTQIATLLQAPTLPSNKSDPQGVAQGITQGIAQAPSPTETAQSVHIDSIIAGQTQLTTADLLPTYDKANDFTKENPVSKLLQEQNFLQAGYHMGINTISQSNKIKYLDLRSCPPIPKQDVSPFLNSSYEEPAGAKRRYLEIGS
jgi:hypothetical protein